MIRRRKGIKNMDYKAARQNFNDICKTNSVPSRKQKIFGNNYVQLILYIRSKNKKSLDLQGFYFLD